MDPQLLGLPWGDGKQRRRGRAVRGHLCSSNPIPLHRLKPFTSYKFRVKATNDIGDSEFSKESEPLTTLQAGQCPPLGSLSLGPLGTCWALGILFWGRSLQRWVGHWACWALGLAPQAES